MSLDLGVLGAAMLELGRVVRDQVERSRGLEEPIADAVVEVGGDQQFWIDRRVEPALLAAIEAWPSALLPVLLWCEGFPEAPLRIGGATRAPQVQLMLDPIDGTRGLMLDKRSAWFLGVAAPGHVGSPRLRDAIVSVAVELPTSKQGLTDEFLWRQDVGTCVTRGARGCPREPLLASPSRARRLEHGFGTVVTFFPRNILPAARLAQAIRLETTADFFEDQYLSSGGQMIELSLGHDRFVCDLRADWPDELGLGRKAAKPYDLAAAPIAKSLGVCLTDAGGRELDAPFSLDLDMSWCGYANAEIRSLVEPHVMAALGAHTAGKLKRR